MEDKGLIINEIYMKCFHNGYFATFKDCALNARIEIPNPNFGEKDPFKGTTQLLGAIEGDEEGNLDITPLIYAYMKAVEDNPGSKVRAKLTGWSRCLHFSPDLLSTPSPEGLLDIFKKSEKEE